MPGNVSSIPGGLGGPAQAAHQFEGLAIFLGQQGAAQAFGAELKGRAGWKLSGLELNGLRLWRGGVKLVQFRTAQHGAFLEVPPSA